MFLRFLMTGLQVVLAVSGLEFVALLSLGDCTVLGILGISTISPCLVTLAEAKKLVTATSWRLTLCELLAGVCCSVSSMLFSMIGSPRLYS